MLSELPCSGEVSDRADAACFFDEGLQALGGLDVLVNNAGIAGPTGRVEEINPGGLGPLPQGVPDGTIQLRAARRAASEAEPERLDHQSLIRRRAASASPCDPPMRPRNGAW